MSGELVGKVLLEGTRLTHKTDLAPAADRLVGGLESTGGLHLPDARLKAVR